MLAAFAMNFTTAELTKILTDWGGQIIAALIGAVVGASLVFRYQNRKEATAKREARFEAVIRAQHSLFFMWRILAAIRYNYLDEDRADKLRHRKLRIYWLSEHRLAVNFAELTFLHTPGFRPLLTNLFSAERGFLSALDAVRERNQQMTGMIPAAGHAFEYDPATKMMGTPVNLVKDGLLESATTALYRSVDNGMTLCEQAFAQLRERAKAEFPGDVGLLQDSNLTKEAFFAATAPAKPKE